MYIGKGVTILILIDGFLQYPTDKIQDVKKIVTILILIDGFLQSIHTQNNRYWRISHNPYFNRWFSAIDLQFKLLNDKLTVTILILIDGFLQFKYE